MLACRQRARDGVYQSVCLRAPAADGEFPFRREILPLTGRHVECERAVPDHSGFLCLSPFTEVAADPASLPWGGGAERAEKRGQLGYPQASCQRRGLAGSRGRAVAAAELTENTGRASTLASAGLGQDDTFAARCAETRPLCWSGNIRRGNICQRRRLASKGPRC